jgi:hypothetical protein
MSCGETAVPSIKAAVNAKKNTTFALNKNDWKIAQNANKRAERTRYRHLEKDYRLNLAEIDVIRAGLAGVEFALRRSRSIVPCESSS